MKLVHLLTYSGTILVVNAISLGYATLLIATRMQLTPPLLMLLAPVLGIAAFVTARRYKSVLLAAIVINALLPLVFLPFLLFAVRNGAPVGWFIPAVLICYFVPLLTVSACVMRWPRQAAR